MIETISVAQGVAELILGRVVVAIAVAVVPAISFAVILAVGVAAMLAIGVAVILAIVVAVILAIVVSECSGGVPRRRLQHELAGHFVPFVLIFGVVVAPVASDAIAFAVGSIGLFFGIALVISFGILSREVVSFGLLRDRRHLAEMTALLDPLGSIGLLRSRRHRVKMTALLDSLGSH